MSIVRQKFILIGALAGATIVLGTSTTNYPFQNGELVLTCDEGDMRAHSAFLERNWQAYPEGHPKVEEFFNGKRDLQKSAPVNSGPAVPGGVLAGGQGPEAGTDPVVSSGHDGAEAGSAGVLPNGDGPQAELNERLQRAVMALDPRDPNHWTQDGRPAMKAVEAIYGSAGITRADVEAVAPGYVRPTVD